MANPWCHGLAIHSGEAEPQSALAVLESGQQIVALQSSFAGHPLAARKAVSHEDDGCVQLLVGVVQEAGVVVFGETHDRVTLP